MRPDRTRLLSIATLAGGMLAACHGRSPPSTTAEASGPLPARPAPSISCPALSPLGVTIDSTSPAPLLDRLGCLDPMAPAPALEVTLSCTALPASSSPCPRALLRRNLRVVGLPPPVAEPPSEHEEAVRTALCTHLVELAEELRTDAAPRTRSPREEPCSDPCDPGDLRALEGALSGRVDLRSQAFWSQALPDHCPQPRRGR